jgi:mono/diheme cytochrome c family protein
MKKYLLAAFVLVAALPAAVPPSAGSSLRPATALRTTQAETAPRTPAAPKSDAANGKKLFVSFGCYQCHGYEGQGSTATGPRLAPRPIPFAAFTKQLRRPSNEMPPYTAKVTTDAQLADIYAFLQSIPPPKDVDSIPLLK